MSAFEKMVSLSLSLEMKISTVTMVDGAAADLTLTYSCGDLDPCRRLLCAYRCSSF